MRALIMTADEAEDVEVLYPYYRLREEGLQVDVASLRRGPVAMKHGYTIEANMAFDEVKHGDYDLLVIPGGRGPEKVRLSSAALEVTRGFFREGKPVASICHGPQVLISAGVVKGRTLTSWPGIRDDVVAAGGNYVDREVVVDGNLVSSRMPADLPSFTRAMVRLISAGEGRR